MDIKEHTFKNNQFIPYTSVHIRTRTYATVRTIESFCTDFLLIFVQRNNVKFSYKLTTLM